MAVDVIAMLEHMAEMGTPPPDGCSLFNVGYEDAFDRLKRKYLEARFARGGSAEKFVVGTYGSGKTHFVRHLTEIARDMECVTSEVALDKSLDPTKSLDVYKEVVREIRPPGTDQKGMQTLLLASVERVRRQGGGNQEVAERLVQAWLSGLDKATYELDAFGRIARHGIEAHLVGDQATFTAACRWLEGDIGDKALARDLAVSVVGKSEENLHGRRLLLTLFQFVKRAGFRGTVVIYDEAEQGMAVDRKSRDRMHSMLQSGINALSDLKNGSAMVVYALTPEIIEEMERFAALQQRVADPGKGQGFFDGNTLAPIIDLNRQTDAAPELRALGQRLVDLAYGSEAWNKSVPQADVQAAVNQLADEVVLDEASSANRRVMVKRTCATLMTAHDEGMIDTRARPERMDEDEV